MRRSLKIWCVAGVGAVVLAFLSFLILKTPRRFSESLPFLSGKSYSVKSLRLSESSSGVPLAPPTTWLIDQEKFVLASTYDEVVKMADRDLGSRARKQYLTTGTCTFASTGGPDDLEFKLDVNRKSKTETYVTVNSRRQETWLDRAHKWMQDNFRRGK